MCKLWIFLVIQLTFWQCSHYYYVPSLPNTPTLREKGESAINISLAAQNESAGFEAQGAFATSDKHLFAGEIGWYDGSEKTDAGDYFGKGRGYMLSAGAGLYRFYTDRRFERGWYLSALGSAGFGHTANEYYAFNTKTGKQESAGTTTVNMLRLGVQPAAAWTSPWFDVVISARLSGLYYAGVHFDVEGSIVADEDAAKLRAHRTQVLLEPGLTLRAGFRKLKLQCQLTGAIGAQSPVAAINLGAGLAYLPRR